MICFYIDGSIQTKVNICSYKICLKGEVIVCVEEKGSFLPQKLLTTESAELSLESDCGSDDEEESEDVDTERFEMRTNSVVEIVQKDNVLLYIHLQSPLNFLS